MKTVKIRFNIDLGNGAMIENCDLTFQTKVVKQQDVIDRINEILPKNAKGFMITDTEVK